MHICSFVYTQLPFFPGRLGFTLLNGLAVTDTRPLGIDVVEDRPLNCVLPAFYLSACFNLKSPAKR